MRKKRLILFLLILSWPLTLLHRLLNKSPAMPVTFPYNKIATTDLQWYLLDVGIMLSFLSILSAFIIYIFSNLNKDRDVAILTATVAVVWIIDIIHYGLFFRQNEFILLSEGMVMVSGTVLMWYMQWKKG